MLPTAWPVRLASMLAVAGPSSLSRLSSRGRSGCDIAASTRESVIWRTSRSSTCTRVVVQELLCNCSCGYCGPGRCGKAGRRGRRDAACLRPLLEAAAPHGKEDPEDEQPDQPQQADG